MVPTGWYGSICGICFEQITEDECAVDEDGQKWDVHRGECARQSGIVEAEVTHVD